MVKVSSLLKFNKVMSIAWTIVAIISGIYAVMNGGAMTAENDVADPSIEYIVASFGVPGLISIIFAFCNSIEDVMKIKAAVKDVKDEIKQQ